MRIIQRYKSLFILSLGSDIFLERWCVAAFAQELSIIIPLLVRHYVPVYDAEVLHFSLPQSTFLSICVNTCVPFGFVITLLVLVVEHLQIKDQLAFQTVISSG